MTKRALATRARALPESPTNRRSRRARKRPRGLLFQLQIVYSSNCKQEKAPRTQALLQTRQTRLEPEAPQASASPATTHELTQEAKELASKASLLRGLARKEQVKQKRKMK